MLDATGKKMTKIADELIAYFLQMGSQQVKMDLSRDDVGYTLILDSSYDQEHHKQVRDLDRFLNVQERNEGIEDVYWELAGMGGELTGGAELHLIGQMIDEVKLDIREQDLRLMLKKYYIDQHL